MSDGSPRPTNWKETIPFVVWGVLVGAFGLTGVEHFVVSVGQYWRGKSWTDEGLQAAVAFVGMAGLAAMIIHGGRIREKFSDIRWLIGACMFAVVVLAFSPYVEQRRWPFEWLVKELRPASAQDIAAAIKPELDQLLQNRAPPALPQPDQGELASTKQQLRIAQGNLKQYQIEAEQAHWNDMSAICTVKLLFSIEANNPSKGLSNTIILLTSAPSMTRIHNSIYAIFDDVIRRLDQQHRAALPGTDFIPPFRMGVQIDYTRNLDAPRLPNSGTTGITVHGRSGAADFLVATLSTVFLTHQTAELPSDALLGYYRRIFGSNRFDTVVWLEIGEGSPWSPDHPNCRG